MRTSRIQKHSRSRMRASSRHSLAYCSANSASSSTSSSSRHCAELSPLSRVDHAASDRHCPARSRRRAAAEFRRAAVVGRGVFNRGDSTSSLVEVESVDCAGRQRGTVARPLPVLACDAPFTRDRRRLDGTAVSAPLSAMNAQPLHVGTALCGRSARRNIRSSVRSRRSRRTQERGSSGSLVAGGEGGFASDRRFQMGSMGDGGGEISTLTAADDDDVG